MTEKADLTPNEFDLIARTAVLAAAAVAISKYSGRGGQGREFDVLRNEYENAARQNSNNPILQTLLLPIVREQVTRLKQQFQDDPKQTVYQEFKMVALNRCAQVAALLDEKASAQDAAQYKECVVQTCQRVAEASAEGGFLGIGGTPVNTQETGVILQIQRALRVE